MVSSMRGRLPLKIIVPILAISIFAVGSFATSVSISSSNLAAQQGVSYNVGGDFTAASNGFQVVRADSSATSPPCSWSNGGSCTSALTAGDWQYSVTLALTASAQASHTYTLNVKWDTGSGYANLGSTGTLTFTTSSTITPGETMTFSIDTTNTSFTAPNAITITVA